MNRRVSLLRRVELLELRLQQPPSLAAEVLRTATDVELEQIELQLTDGGESELMEALVSRYAMQGAAPDVHSVHKSGEPGS